MPPVNPADEDDALGLQRAEIAEISPHAAVALAARCALRVAPVLADSGTLKYWGKRSRKHLVSVESAAWIALLYAHGSSFLEPSEIDAIINGALSAAEDAADDNASARAAKTAAAAAAAVQAYADDAFARGISETYKAFSHSAYAAAAPFSREAENHKASACARAATRVDYNLLRRYGSGPIPTEFFTRPLWESPRGTPSGWDGILSNWQAALKEAGFSELYFRHDQVRRGELPDKSAITLWIEKHLPKVQSGDDPANIRGSRPVPNVKQPFEMLPLPPVPKLLSLDDFKQLSHWGAVALALRCAIRVTPILGKDGNFDYWGDSARRRVIAIESAIYNAAVGLHANLNVPQTAALHAYESYLFATYAANVVKAQGPTKAQVVLRISSAARVAGRVAKAAAFAIYANANPDLEVRRQYRFAQNIDGASAKDKVFDFAYQAYRFAVSAVDSDSAFLTAAQADYEWLRQMPAGSEPPDFAAFLNFQLWLPSVMLKAVADALPLWHAALLKIQLPEIYYRYLSMTQGERLDWDECFNWVFRNRDALYTEGPVPTDDMVEQQEKDWLVTASLNPEARAPTEPTSPSKPTEPAPVKTAKTPHPEQTGEPSRSVSASERPTPFTDGVIPAAMPDRFAGKDHLGRNHLAQVLAAMFDAPQQGTPFTIAIFGPWGEGKTAVMEMIESNLEQARHRKFCIAKFNAWEYEHTANIRAGLAQEVVKGLTKGRGWRGWWKRKWLTARYALKEYRSDIFWLAFKLIAVAVPIAATGAMACKLFDPNKITTGAWAGFFAGTSVFIATAWGSLKTIFEHPISTKLETYMKLPTYGEHLGQVPVIRRQLQNVCALVIPQKRSKFRRKLESMLNLVLPQTWLKEVPDRLVVFVDDLDRCGSDCIINTLDAVRLVMDIPGTIVVLLMDQRIAMKAVADKYKELADKERDENEIARDYIGKIVQLPIILPISEPKNIRGYIRESLFRSAKGGGKPLETVKDVPAALTQDAPNSALPPQASKPQPQPASEQQTVSPATQVPPPAGGKASASAPTASTTSPSQIAMKEPPAPSIVVPQRLQAIQEEMLDAETDRDAFMEYADLFQFSNPRQLLRLRNSFRVLKGFMALQTAEGAAPTTEEEIRQSLLLLFWLEFLNDCKRSARNAYSSLVYENRELKSQDGNQPLNGKSQDLARKIRGEMENQFGPGFYQQESFLRLKARAKGLVLPFHEDLDGVQPALLQANMSTSTPPPSSPPKS